MVVSSTMLVLPTTGLKKVNRPLSSPANERLAHSAFAGIGRNRIAVAGHKFVAVHGRAADSAGEACGN